MGDNFKAKLKTHNVISVQLISFVLLLGVSVSLWASPDIKSWKTKNGAKVYFVKASQIPLVDIRVLFKAGSARDKSKPGLAVLTNRIMPMGANGKVAKYIANQFESVGAKQGNGAQRDSANFSLRTLSKSKILDKTTGMLATLISSPDFNEKDLIREKSRALIGLKQLDQSPSSIAKKRFYKELYGDHPYSTLPSGTVEGIQSITREDLVNFYKKYYVASNAVVAIVGDLTEDEAKDLANRLVANLEEGKPAEKLPDVKPIEVAKTIKLDHPSSQTHIYMGHVGVYRGEKDYYALYLANHTLGGGGLVSRLGDEVREKRGLSYSVYSYFIPMQKSGPFILGMQTSNSKATEGLKVLRSTLDTFHKEGMKADEFKASTKNITGGFPLRVDTNKKIVEYIAMIGFYELPITYLKDFNKHINALKLKNVNTVFSKRVNPKKMITVIVGGK